MLEGKDIQDIRHQLSLLSTRNFRITPEGGYAVRLINGTGVSSEKGRLLNASTSVAMAVDFTGADAQEILGVFYESGIADGEYAWIVTGGIAEVLLKENTGSTMSNWVKSADVAGYSDATLAAPPGGGVVQLDEHMQETGHSLQTVAAGGVGTYQLLKILMHFN